MTPSSYCSTGPPPRPPPPANKCPPILPLLFLLPVQQIDACLISPRGERDRKAISDEGAMSTVFFQSSFDEFR
jgi:hypothetical protein